MIEGENMDNMKFLWVGGLVAVLSTLMFNRASESLIAGSLKPDLATLASLHKKSDPFILMTAFASTPNEAPAPKARTARVADAELAARAGVKPRAIMEISDYVLLHHTRSESDIQPEAMTAHAWSR